MKKKTTDALQNFDALDKQAGLTRKRLFIGLILSASLLLCLFLFFIFIIPYIGLAQLHPILPWIFGGGLLLLILFISWASLGLVFSILLGRCLPFTKRIRGLTIKFFLPLMILLGRIVSIPKQQIRSSFVKVNNELVCNEAGHYHASEILLLMPHCLQNSRCKMRLTYNVLNCKRCGKCPIAGILTLSERYNVHLAIATGGTIARRIVVQNKPRFIIAVACERDLSSGIQDVYPLPCFGVMNERPHGPCLDTLVSLNMLETALRRFICEDELPMRFSFPEA